MFRLKYLLFIRSKIQFFESKSQLVVDLNLCFHSCLSDQRYNFLKANHNIKIDGINRQRVVYQIKDTIFWKQITTNSLIETAEKELFIRSKIQFFESKSQRHRRKWAWNYGCLSDQRYNFLKANQNITSVEDSNDFVVYQIKDTIFWKQITTIAKRI